MKKVVAVLLVVFVVACWLLPQAALADDGPGGKGGKHGYGGELGEMEDFRGGGKGAAKGEGVVLPAQTLEELGIFQLTDAAGEAKHPIFSPDGSRIAYMYDDDGNTEIRVMELDFSSRTPRVVADYAVTNATEQCAHLEGWSPNGTQILFRSRYSDWGSGEDYNRLWIAYADGSAPPDQLKAGVGNSSCFGGPTLYQASFSPDGSKIVYTMGYQVDWDRTGKDIYVMDSDGSDVVQLTDTYQVCELSPRWSPDGSKILYKKCDFRVNRIADLWVMDADGSDQEVVVAGVNANFFGWSPDGQWIVYECKNEDSPSDYLRDVYKVRPDGSGNTRLTPSDDYCEHTPLWGPDGTILYRSDELRVTGETDFSSTWVMRADGSGKTMINPWGGKWHDWSPDGKWIVFQTCEPEETEGTEQIFIMRNPLFTPPVGGKAYPVNKIAVLAPWIALGAAIIAGASLLVLRRRRTES